MDGVVFFLSKVLTPLFNPYCLIVAFAAFFLLRARKTLVAGGKKVLFVWAVIVWVCAFSLGSSLVAELFVRSWEEPLTSRESVDIGEYDAVVVLGGSVDPSVWMPGNPNLNDSAERLTMASTLSHDLPYIVLSGGSGDMYHQNLKETDVMRDILVSLGVPPQKILSESNSRNTFENARLTRELLEQNGLRRVLLVTSALHMRRSAAVFEKAGFVPFDRQSSVAEADSQQSPDTQVGAADAEPNAAAVPIVFRPYVVDSSAATIDFPECIIPDARNLVRTFSVAREMAGYIAYAALGYL